LKYFKGRKKHDGKENNINTEKPDYSKRGYPYTEPDILFLFVL